MDKSSALKELLEELLNRSNDTVGARSLNIENTSAKILALLSLSHLESEEAILNKFIEDYAKEICLYCLEKKLGYPELHEGRYHTKKGISPSWENERCRAEDFRERANKIIAKDRSHHA